MAQKIQEELDQVERQVYVLEKEENELRRVRVIVHPFLFINFGRSVFKSSKGFLCPPRFHFTVCFQSFITLQGLSRSRRERVQSEVWKAL